MAQRDKDRDLEMAARKLSQTKLSKKEKQKQKEAKRLSKTQKLDADKVGGFHISHMDESVLFPSSCSSPIYKMIYEII